MHPDTPPPAAPWHALFAPLPDGLIPSRKPVGSPQVMASPAGAAIAGWEQLTLELNAGSAGMRILIVTLDGSGRPIAASDWVLSTSERSGRETGDAPVVEYRHETVGGRFELDGTFHGTRWLTVTEESGTGEPLQHEAIPSAPSAEDVAALRSLVAELIRRAPRSTR